MIAEMGNLGSAQETLGELQQLWLLRSLFLVDSCLLYLNIVLVQ